MLLLQLKEGEILKVGDAEIAYIKRGPKNRNQIRIAVKADISIKVTRTKEFISEELKTQAQAAPKAPRKRSSHQRGHQRTGFRNSPVAVSRKPRY